MASEFFDKILNVFQVMVIFFTVIFPCILSISRRLTIGLLSKVNYCNISRDYIDYRLITSLIIYIKILLDCDWLISVQLIPNSSAIFCNQSAIFCNHSAIFVHSTFFCDHSAKICNKLI